MIELNHGVDVHFEYQLKILIYRRITQPHATRSNFFSARRQISVFNNK